MKQYLDGLLPGPTRVHEDVLTAIRNCGETLGSADIEAEFKEDYTFCCDAIAKIANTSNDVVILSGEGMVALWGALKSVLQANDVVVSAANGLYGKGLGDMASDLGAKVHYVEFGDRETVDPARVIEAIKTHKPKLVTMVHCDTPTGMLNNMAGIGQAAHEVGALFLVDYVSSFAGAPINNLKDEMQIDLGLIGSQKALSLPPDLAFVTVSERAWKVIEHVKYKGYDALQPWHNVLNAVEWPYTPNWHGVVGLRVSLTRILNEGIAECFERHMRVSEACIAAGKDMGLTVFPATPSPTVTCFEVPANLKWEDIDKAMRTRGIVLGCSFGKYAGKVFRIGHMGTQADADLVGRAMEALRSVLAELRGDK